MPALSIYSNVENTALVILQRKGYRVWKDERSGLFMTEKNGWDFAGESATDLLAAVAIYEHHAPTEYQEYWWKIDDPFLYESVPTRRPDYRSVVEKR